MESNKDTLIKKYKNLKIYCYLLCSFWIIGISLAIAGLAIALSIGMDGKTQTSKNIFYSIIFNNGEIPQATSNLNQLGIISLSTLFAIGLFLALGSQILFPFLMKKEIKKHNDKNYVSLLKNISTCYMSPLNGSLTLIKQINWIINYDETQSIIMEEVNSRIKSEENNESLTRLEKQKKEQEKIDLIYAKENELIKKTSDSKNESTKKDNSKQNAQ